MRLERLQGALLVLRMQAIGPRIQPVREVRRIGEAQEVAEAIRPPELIVRIRRIITDDLHVPRAFRQDAVDRLVALQSVVEIFLILDLLINVDEDADDLFGMTALAAHDIARRMKPLVTSVVHLHAVVNVVGRIAAQILDALREGGQRSVHIVGMQARTPRVHRIGEVVLVTEADHAAELIGPDGIGDAEVRIDFHVPKPRVDGIIDRADAELLVLDLLVHLVDERIERVRPRLARICLGEKLILLMPLCNPLNGCRQILPVIRGGCSLFHAKHQNLLQ